MAGRIEGKGWWGLIRCLLLGAGHGEGAGERCAVGGRFSGVYEVLHSGLETEGCVDR